jgi:hypothetical protein
MNTAVESDMSITKQRLVVTHTIRHTEIPGFLGSWVTNTPSVCPYIFIKNITCLNVGLLRIGQVF